MVELALVFPVMLILLAAAIDIGRLFYAFVAVENAAKEGALVGARNPVCVDTQRADCGDPKNVVWHVKNEASNIGDQFQTTVECRNLGGSAVPSMADCVDGFTYLVRVTYPFQLVTPVLSSLLNPVLTLSSESHATVISDGYDPSGLELLIWVDGTNALNSSEIMGACELADPPRPFYFAPCQDDINVDNYLEFAETQRIDFRVRVRNTGNLNLTDITYAWAENGATIDPPGDCGALPPRIDRGTPASFCSFHRDALAGDSIDGLSDHTISAVASGLAQGVSTGAINSSASVKVKPVPRLAVTLQASAYRLGGDGGGFLGNADYPNGPIDLARDPAGPSEIQDPTAWLRLQVVNQGGAAEAFTVGLQQNGVDISIPCPIPARLNPAGQGGDSFGCILPRQLNANGTFTFEAAADATNAIQVGSAQRAVTVTTDTCAAGESVVPNLVDTLTPDPDRSNKTVAQAEALWQSAGFGQAVTVAGTGSTVVTQDLLAYTCELPDSTTVTIEAP